jgi:hypothetical protein
MAEVSAKDPNFVINRCGGTSADEQGAMDLVRRAGGKALSYHTAVEDHDPRGVGEAQRTQPIGLGIMKTRSFMVDAGPHPTA